MQFISANARLAASAGIVCSLRQWRSPACCESTKPPVQPAPLCGRDGPDLPAASSTRPFLLDSAVRCISSKKPHSVIEPVRHDCGEDAFFLAVPTDRVMAIGIADGVSSWARIGIDAALFAWELMNTCEAVVARTAHADKPMDRLAADRPLDVLRTGYREMISKGGEAPFGSSTACLASLDRQNGQLRVVNLGDSGALVLRSDSLEASVVLATKEQVHSFNCPYQLMISPQGTPGQIHGDSPSSSKEYQIKAEAGDLVILGTDGFFDNVWRPRILEITTEMQNAPCAEIAERLVRLAHEKSESLTEHVPFTAAARLAGFHHPGGKPDDITVLVARVHISKS